MIKLRYLYFSSFLLLFGCAHNETVTNQQAKLINARLDENKATFEACYKKIENTSEAIYVRKNILVGSDN